jgi:hypothetical protein
MAFNTYLTFRCTQEMICPRSRLVGSMAFKTVTLTGIGVMDTALIQTGMTSEAQIALFTFQERSAVAGMRHVTRGAVSLYYGGMPLSLTCLVLHSGMAAQTQSLLRHLERECSALMTGGALARSHGLMHRCAPQRRFAPAVGVMTFGTAGRGYSLMRRAYRRGGVTGGAHGALLLMQEFRCRAAVGRMAGATPLRYGWMELRTCILILSAHVALKTQFLRCYRMEAFMFPAMGFMANLTLPFCYRLMHIFPKLGGVESFMA